MSDIKRKLLEILSTMPEGMNPEILVCELYRKYLEKENIYIESVLN